MCRLHCLVQGLHVSSFVSCLADLGSPDNGAPKMRAHVPDPSSRRPYRGAAVVRDARGEKQERRDVGHLVEPKGPREAPRSYCGINNVSSITSVLRPTVAKQ